MTSRGNAGGSADFPSYCASPFGTRPVFLPRKERSRLRPIASRRNDGRGDIQKALIGDTLVPTGKVKWFNASKGFGFIQADDGSKDVFVHISAVEKAGLPALNEGQKVGYELVVGKNGKTSAENLKPMCSRDFPGDSPQALFQRTPHWRARRL